jgi:shikimate kinase
MQQNLIFLIGMPGAGKTFWGRAWAEQHGWAFVDLDDHVVQMTGYSIPQIFKSAGEGGFRAIEAVVLEQTIKGSRKTNTIIATGGGTAIYEDNMEVMLAAGCVVFLSAATKTLTKHLQQSGEERPLLQELSEEKLEDLTKERLPFYARAHQQIEVEKITEATFAQILQACSNRPS